MKHPYMIHLCEQRSPEWLALRRTKRTASATPVVMGFVGSITELAREYQGHSKPVTPAMQQGTDQEDAALEAFRNWYAKGSFSPMVLSAGDYLASLDGFCPDSRVIVEIKTPMRGWKSKAGLAAQDGELLPQYFWQIQHQLMVAQAEKAWLWLWDAALQDGIAVPCYPDPDAWEKLRARWDAVWPQLHERSDIEWVAAAKDWRAAKEQLAQAQEAEAAARAEIDALMGEAEFSVGGGVTATRGFRRGTIDWKKVESQHLANVDLDPFRKEGSTTLVLSSQ